MSFTVLITDAVDPVCLTLLEEAGVTPNVQLKQTPEQLKAHAAAVDGWIIRSGTQITADLIEAAGQLKVIGRAGVGVDNVDLQAATRKGILVINAPDGNTLSTAEHTCAMILSLARRIPPAHASLQGGKWERKAFTGSELYEKTLGIVGIGKIGQVVAARMQGFGMEVIGFDPVLAPERAAQLGIQLVSLGELYAKSDFITVHTPLNAATRGLLNTETLQQCKSGVRIINCARGGIVEETALLQALESGHVAGAALDVYSVEPPTEALMALVQHPEVVATPHIAASTEEAQLKVARQITEQVIRALKGEPVLTPVNAMAIRMAAQPEVQPYLALADRIGQVAGQLAADSLDEIHVICQGDLPQKYAEVLQIAALKGVLSRWSSEPVNLINAPKLAEEMGLKVNEEVQSVRGTYTNLLSVRLQTKGGSIEVAGTLFGKQDGRLVRINGYELEVRPEGCLLCYQNEDRPGMLAAVGLILAEAEINIGALALGRRAKGTDAMTVISLDEMPSNDTLKRIQALPGVHDTHMIQL